MAIAVAQSLTGGVTTGDTTTLASWTPAADELILVGVDMRTTSIVPTVAGNGLTFTLVDATHGDVLNAQSQHRTFLFKAQGASPSTGAITVTHTGNLKAVSVTAVRLSGVAASAPVEAANSNAGPPVTDDNDMLESITTVTADAWAIAFGGHRNRTFTVPSGETEIAINNSNGAGGEMATLSAWYQGPIASPASTQLGDLNDLSSTTDWTILLVSVKPPSGAATPQALPATTTLTPSIARRLTWARSLPVASTHAPAMTRQLLIGHVLSVTTPSAPVLARFLSLGRTLTPATTFAPAVARQSAYFRALAATSTFGAALVAVALHLRTLAANAPMGVDLARVLNITLAAAATFAVSLARLAVYNVPLAVASGFGVAVKRLITVPLVASLTAAVAMVRLHPRTLAVASTLAPALAILRSFTLAVGSTFTPTLTRRAAYNVPLAAVTTFAPLMLRLFFVELAVSAGLSAALGRDFFVTFAVTSTFAASVIPVYRAVRSLPTVSTFVSGLATLFIPGGGPGPAISSFLARFLHIRK